ncbi:hypothetical protein [Nocardia sp. CC201C]|uniref:hypothetical protein n=1 Tax=Nocardia sp. CC201C TaxID=3044575 RepID=UPI0024A930A1|nr:hypothetical protein [Nocardia sp. CC201C]
MPDPTAAQLRAQLLSRHASPDHLTEEDARRVGDALAAYLGDVLDLVDLADRLGVETGDAGEREIQRALGVIAVAATEHTATLAPDPVVLSGPQPGICLAPNPPAAPAIPVGYVVGYRTARGDWWISNDGPPWTDRDEAVTDLADASAAMPGVDWRVLTVYDETGAPYRAPEPPPSTVYLPGDTPPERAALEHLARELLTGRQFHSTAVFALCFIDAILTHTPQPSASPDHKDTDA